MLLAPVVGVSGRLRDELPFTGLPIDPDHAVAHVRDDETTGRRQGTRSADAETGGVNALRGVAMTIRINTAGNGQPVDDP